MKKLLLLFLLFPVVCVSQEFVSKRAEYNGQIIKMENPFTVNDSIITVITDGKPYKYIIENQIEHYYQVDYYGMKANINLVETNGRALGFKYTHIMSIVYLGDNAPPPLSYFAVIKEE